jgi:hypothetical protein
MAQRTVIQLTDDLDGNPIPDGKGETIRFGLDRAEYEIDLPNKNAKALRDAFAKYIGAARHSTATTGSAGGTRSAGGSRARSSRTSTATSRDYDPKQVRAWAEAQGIEVSARGRVPADLVARFQEANT